MKQPCRAIRELLGAYADHELRPAQAEQVESHLDTCVSCRRELGETQKLGRLAQSVTHPQLAEDYWDWLRTRVWRRLRERRREPIPRYRPSFLWAKLAAAGAGALVLLVVVIYGWRMFERPAFTGQNRVSEQAPVAAQTEATPGPSNVPTEQARSRDARKEARAQTSSPPARPEAKTNEGVSATALSADQARTAPESPNVGVSGTIQPAAPLDAPQTPAMTASSRPRRRKPILNGPVLLESPPLPETAVLDTGTVLLSVKTDTSGRVLNAAVRRSSGSLRLDSLAILQMLRSRFSAARQDNRPVPGLFDFPFRINRERPQPQDQRGQDKTQDEQTPAQNRKQQHQEGVQDSEDQSPPQDQLNQPDSNPSNRPLKKKIKK